MPKVSEISAKDLSLDLNNFRLLPQKNEKEAIKAMITIKSDRFWGLMDSILDAGFWKTENIIVQKDKKGKLIVREGNGRVAALKLILGYYKLSDFDVPKQYVDKIEEKTASWKKENEKVVAYIFEENESAQADHIVAITHGKGNKASREPWTSVATARHNRDALKIDEPALDVLEKYLSKANDITPLQKELWASDYYLTVLHDLIRRLTPVLEFAKMTDFAKAYPGAKIPKEFNELISEIGRRMISFEDLRDRDTFNLLLNRMKLAPLADDEDEDDDEEGGGSGANGAGGKGSGKKKSAKKKQAKKQSTKARAISNNDPRFITATLKKFIILGEKREKIVALRDEAVRLKDIESFPYSFCFLLRSMFELSGNVYCNENKIQTFKLSKENKRVNLALIDVLKAANKHLIANADIDTTTQKKLHGAITELSKPEGLLSVTSLNQLVHNPNFSTHGSHLCAVFGNIFPLLEMLNS